MRSLTFSVLLAHVDFSAVVVCGWRFPSRKKDRQIERERERERRTQTQMNRHRGKYGRKNGQKDRETDGWTDHSECESERATQRQIQPGTHKQTATARDTLASNRPYIQGNKKKLALTPDRPKAAMFSYILV